MGSHSKPKHLPQHRKPPRTAQVAAAVAGTAAAGTIAAAAMASPAMAAQDAAVHPAPASGVITVAEQPRAEVTATPARPLLATVKPGDTLSAMAADLCSSAARWPGMYAANRDKLSNPNVIYPGQSLRVRCDDTSPPAVPQAQVIQAAAVQVPQTQQQAAPQAPASTSGTRYSGSGAMQQCIISRESGGNPDVTNASGHYGLYQFSESTWVGSGGSAADFGHASVAEQNRVFAQAVAARGYSDWTPYDGC